MGRLLDLTLNGVTYGMIYAAMALSLVLIWRATRIINFAQGAMAMFTTYVAVTVIDHGIPYWVAFVTALLVGLAMGAAVERVLIRRLQAGTELSPVIVTLGLLILLEGVAGALWGGGDRSFPAYFSQIGLVIGGSQVAFSSFDAFTVGMVLLLMLLMWILFQATDLGLKMRASAFAPEVARLLGVRVGGMLTLGWALAALAGSLAGLLIAPKVLLFPNNMDEVLVFGFTAAVVGGLDSPVGALVGGVVTGLVLSYVGGYLGSSLETVGALVLLLVVLSVRPQGIFSRAAPRRV